jgi:hypothetical protein
MKNLKNVYKALLAGKKLIHTDGTVVDIGTCKGCTFYYPEDWKVHASTWEMKKPVKWYITSGGDVLKADAKRVTLSQHFGMRFKKEAQARKARNQMKRSNLLRYWVSTKQDLDEGIHFIKRKGEGYDYYSDGGRRSLAEVYMLESTAIAICDALNKGELKL